MRRIVALLLLLAIGPAAADELAGIATIVDGDTIRVSGHDGRIRLWGLDAPERDHPFGPEATEHLAALAAGRFVRCEAVDRDRYGRIVAVCGTAEVPDLGLRQIEDGFGEPYERYLGRGIRAEIYRAAGGLE